MISTPGGRVITKELVMHTPLNLIGKLLRISLGWPRHRCVIGHELDEGAQGAT
jgi:hypothetical protein